MVNYYDILKVSPKASNAEIKSAYRRLARKLHPDVNGGSEQTAQEFAKIARAYGVLGNPQERAGYDQKLLQAEFNASNGDSVFSSTNAYASRMRQMVYEKRYNEIIDRMIADERQESIDLQKVIFPTVSLFVSTIFVGIFKPMFFTNAAIIGKILLVSLFVAGLIHLFSRLRSGFERYTYDETVIHDSILDGNEPESKPYSRFTAVAFLVVGLLVSLGIGVAVGSYLELFVAASMPSMYSSSLRPEFVFYPPIIVLLVDLMHAFVSRLDV
jgi:hypothetical protein